MISDTSGSTASRNSTPVTVASRGRPVAGSRPRTSVSKSLSSGTQPPTSSFTVSEVRSPIARRWCRRMKLAMASSKS
jgi:hypothetical protein